MSTHFNPYSWCCHMATGFRKLKKKLFDHVSWISITFKYFTFIVVECLFTIGVARGGPEAVADLGGGMGGMHPPPPA